ncbi:MAG: hypothetical protein JXM69_08675 [Anaerolineae bacterium]|nr:hypothetical protein [Anaerolineae bacterium]
MKSIMFRWAGWLLVLPMLACTLYRQTPQPAAPVEQLAFDVQTATPTLAPIFDAPSYTPDPNATPTLTPTSAVTATVAATITTEKEATPIPTEAVTPTPKPPPPPTPTVAPAEPLQGSVWDFEDGFAPWGNPYGDACPGSGLANGWTAFSSRDQYGSACMNQTVWKDNVHSGHNAQEITFAYVGIEAGVFRTAPTIPGHRYTIEAYMRREFSPATVAVSLGVDLNGGTDWQSTNVQWSPWNEDVDDAWGKTSVTVTATGEQMTIFLKGSHPYPEPGGTLRLDNVSVVDLGPA